jgi:hypothetical protein
MNIAILLLALATTSPDAPTTTSAPVALSPAAVAAVPVVFAETAWYVKAYEACADFISSRTRLIQFSVVGMIIALFIIIFTNKW